MAIEVQSEIAGAAVESRFAGVEGAFLWQLTDILYKKDLVDFQLWSGVKRLVSKFKQTYERLVLYVCIYLLPCRFTGDGEELFERDDSNMRKVGKNESKYQVRILREGAFWQLRGQLQGRRSETNDRVMKMISGGSITRSANMNTYST